MDTHNKLVKLSLAFVLSAFCSFASAQKLPNVQQKSVRAPQTVKVDGKATEWDDTFQAYNHATDIFYTMANDDNNLYLVVQSKDKQIINKIIGGGVELTIQKSGKKNDKDGITVTYPLFDAKDRPYIGGGGGGGGMKMVTVSNVGGGGDAQVHTMDIKSDAAAIGKTGVKRDPTEGDSIMMVYNKRLSDKSKNIGVIGIPGLDTLISVYNEDGIKANQRFDNKLVYTLEISIDLKKLGLSVSDAAKFAYHIKLNGAPMGINRVVINGQPGMPTDPGVQQKLQDMMSQIHLTGPGGDPTDFWGEYTLAKK